MADIYHTFTINASLKDVYNGISKPEGLNIWWTKKAEGKPVVGTTYLLDFGDQYQWKAVVTKSKPDEMFELQMTQADDEWMKTKIGFLLTAENNITKVSFYHLGWLNISENYKFSGYCWAMYLRILKRYIEYGEIVQYEKRLNV